ncbi:hypothetical protein K7X08_029931 [Anisodus acutangulus]|uniref:Uncharacterized protein n=1 Tax=Anisodus acutangulus TaxID=402998 RepID=A0A9Q1LLP9_9SOLA|nr:hypothetical protein K7X08_029931 [Anisodus acutangulus]
MELSYWNLRCIMERLYPTWIQRGLVAWRRKFGSSSKWSSENLPTIGELAVEVLAENISLRGRRRDERR